MTFCRWWGCVWKTRRLSWRDEISERAQSTAEELPSFVDVLLSFTNFFFIYWWEYIKFFYTNFTAFSSLVYGISILIVMEQLCRCLGAAWYWWHHLSHRHKYFQRRNAFCLFFSSTSICERSDINIWSFDKCQCRRMPCALLADSTIFCQCRQCLQSKVLAALLRSSYISNGFCE
jgi:hypothetical protein